MVTRILLSIALILSMSGCVTNDTQLNESNSGTMVPSNKSVNLNKDERKIYYKGDYDINYKEPRTVWFKPLLTENGNIMSERTITLSPKDLKWSNEENMEVGEKFRELTKDKR
ncbi:hypothetical protein ACOTWR_06175 [Aliarcobacter butzleri]|uniref:hypothetical protein n=1 Tax=Aliarcobacter butzleri TaxID=28197 RepID=UPI0021B3440B|nr:hypothetical protein [Aliarcobacter butzleri]MCT7563163.1 hypothetical protein [Aliarcobacter butzleri]MCT7578638.1 hypothetical protein [Aliarcobacter butzleri]MCT7647579.1 hypothetical protein [Aliarcobacter butzleri]